MRKKRNPLSVKIANDIIAAYKPESVSEMQDALKDICGPIFEAILNGEMEKIISAMRTTRRQRSLRKIAETVIPTKNSKPQREKPKFPFRVTEPPNLNPF